jgi:hypothetical protein
MSCRVSHRFRFADGLQNAGFSAGVDDPADWGLEEAVDDPGGGDEYPFLPQGADDVISIRMGPFLSAVRSYLA